MLPKFGDRFWSYSIGHDGDIVEDDSDVNDDRDDVDHVDDTSPVLPSLLGGRVGCCD